MSGAGEEVATVAAGPLEEAAAAVGRLLDGAQRVDAAVGPAEAVLLERALRQSASEDPAAVLASVEALLDRTWERLNTGHWRDVPETRRRLFAFASLLKVRLLLQLHGGRPAEALREALVAADRGLLLGAPLLSDGKCALAAAAAELSGALARLRPSQPPSVPLQEEKLLKSMPTETTIKSNSVAAKPLPILCQPSLQKFASSHFFPRLPVVLKGAADHWPARRHWCNLEYLYKVAGARTVPVELGTHYVHSDWGQKLMTLEEFMKNHVETISLQTDAKEERSPPLGYLAQHPLFDQIPELRADICIPEYCCLSDKYDEPLNPDINAWFGPGGTVSPLHFDPKHNLLTQVIGSKHVFLYSPVDTAALYPYDGSLLNNTAQVDPENPDYEHFPNFKNAEAYECLLHPGDILYIPPQWWHHVRSLSTSFSVSFWWE